MKFFRCFLISLPLALGLWGCLDEIDLRQGDPLDDGVVISGRMMVGEEEHTAVVEIQQLFQFTNSNRPLIIPGAIVSIGNDAGQLLDLVYNVEDRNFQGSIMAGDPGFRVESGMSYFVTADIPGSGRYVSDPEELAAPFPLGEVRTALTETRVVNQIDVASIVPAMEYTLTTSLRYPDGTPAFMRWHMTEVFRISDDDERVCYVTLPFEPLAIKVGGNENRTEGSFRIATNPIGHNYGEGHYMIIRQEAISQRAFVYLDRVRRERDRTQSIFEPAGAPIPGNIRGDSPDATENVYGFFYVSHSVVEYIPVRPEEAGAPRPLCPSSVNFPRGEGPCFSCIRERGASEIQPEWWDL